MFKFRHLTIICIGWARYKAYHLAWMTNKVTNVRKESLDCRVAQIGQSEQGTSMTLQSDVKHLCLM